MFYNSSDERVQRILEEFEESMKREGVEPTYIDMMITHIGMFSDWQFTKKKAA